MCPLHRKILLTISNFISKNKIAGKDRRERINSRVVARKTVNKNPNWNHNSSSIFYNHSFSNIRYDDNRSKDKDKDENRDLLWANGEQYHDKDEIKSLKDLIIRLFHEPYFGEKKIASLIKTKDGMNKKDIVSLYREFEKYFGHEEILIDGYKINKYSLWIIKKLNPHHKALIYTLIEIGKVTKRALAKEIVNECINMNNKWNKDWYIWVLTYMIVQTIKTSFDTGTKDLVETVKKLIEYPLQPIKQSSIRSMFPDKVEVAQMPIIKPQSSVTFKPRKLGDRVHDKPKSFKRSLIKTLKKDPENIFDQKLRLYRENIRKQQTINGLDSNPYGNWRVLKYAIGMGNNSVLVHNSLLCRWWWCKTKIKDGNHNFLWTQLKNRRFVMNLKKHTEACFIEQSGSIMTPDLTKTIDNDLNASQTNESSEDTAVTPSSSKQAKRRLLYDRTHKKTGVNISLNKRKAKDRAKPPMQTDCINLSNHLEGHIHLSNKKALYYNMKTYYESLGENPFDYIPLTFHIKDGVDSEEFKQFEEEFQLNETLNDQTSDKLDNLTPKDRKNRMHNIWIVKPGENTNRGSGITVWREFEQIRSLIDTKIVLKDNRLRSYIIQKYIERPLLINKRKFDIRCYGLVTSMNGNLWGYWYKDGYIRTASKEFSLKNVANKYIHLTNDAIQKRSDWYGKFEDGNKLSYKEFQKHFDFNHSDWKIDFENKIYPQMKKLVSDTIKATYIQIDPHRRHHSFELFGYDFMVDENQKVWLIEVNTNPCLELSSSYLSRLIPTLIENVVKIAIDPLFPAPDWNVSRRNQIPDYSDSKFELVFNERTDSSELKDILKQVNLKDIIREEDEEDAANNGSDEEDEESPQKI